jgi:hypothetical protein
MTGQHCTLQVRLLLIAVYSRIKLVASTVKSLLAAALSQH